MFTFLSVSTCLVSLISQLLLIHEGLYNCLDLYYWTFSQGMWILIHSLPHFPRLKTMKLSWQVHHCWILGSLSLERRWWCWVQSERKYHLECSWWFLLQLYFYRTVRDHRHKAAIWCTPLNLPLFRYSHLCKNEGYWIRIWYQSNPEIASQFHMQQPSKRNQNSNSTIIVFVDDRLKLKYCITYWSISSKTALGVIFVSFVGPV